MDQSPGGAFYGVRLSKPDGDAEYARAMTALVAPWQPREPEPQPEPQPEEGVTMTSDIQTMVVSLTGPETIAYALLRIDMVDQSDDGAWTPLTAEYAQEILSEGVLAHRPFKAETDADVAQFVDMVWESYEEWAGEFLADEQAAAPRRGLRYKLELAVLTARLIWMGIREKAAAKLKP